MLLFTQTDWIIVGVIGISAILGIWRGLAKELIALFTWVAAIWVSIVYAPQLTQYWADVIPSEELRSLLAWTTLLGAVLMLGTLVKWGVGRFVAATPFKVPNHLLGGVFGVVRGILLFSVLILLAHLTLLPKQPWWGASTTIPWLEKVTKQYYGWLPANVQKTFSKYSDNMGAKTL
jgi:membrane protein required for colicin V production